MGSTTTKKSYTKRFKVTKTGKLMRRKQGQGHSRANKSRTVIRRKSGEVQVKRVDTKGISRRLN